MEETIKLSRIKHPSRLLLLSSFLNDRSSLFVSYNLILVL
jgi:hypothetical protein